MREREAQQQWSATSHFLHFESPHIARFFSTLFAAYLLCIASRAIGAEPGTRIYYYTFSFLNNNSFGFSEKSRVDDRFDSYCILCRYSRAAESSSAVCPFLNYFSIAQWLVMVGLLFRRSVLYGADSAPRFVGKLSRQCRPFYFKLGISSLIL